MNQSIIGSTDTFSDTRIRPNWRHVGAFLGLTFGLTWLLDLAIYLRGGLATPGMTTILQLQMLLPAFSAIVLGLFFFRESPIYRGRPAGRGRWFYYYFLALTVVYALAALGVWLAPDQPTIKLATSLIPLVLSFLGLLLLVVLRAVAGREAMARVGLAWGNWRYWLGFGLAIVAWYVLQAALNAVTGLGGSQLTPLPTVPGLNPTAMLIVAAVQIGAAGAVPGPRHHLRRGVRLAGLPAKRAVQAGPGARRAPAGRDLGHLALAGHPDGLQLSGPSAARCGADDVVHDGPGVVLSFAVLKSGSVLLAAFLHALNNQVVAFIVVMGFAPSRQRLLLLHRRLRDRDAGGRRLPDPARPDLAREGQQPGLML